MNARSDIALTSCSSRSKAPSNAHIAKIAQIVYRMNFIII